MPLTKFQISTKHLKTFEEKMQILQIQEQDHFQYEKESFISQK
jgi:hypothetical protein